MNRCFFIPLSFLGPIFLCFDSTGEGTASNEVNCLGMSRTATSVRTASKVGNCFGGGRRIFFLGGLSELSMSSLMLFVVLSISTSAKILFIRSSSGGFKKRLSRKSSTSLGVSGLPLTRGFGPKKGECFFREASALDFFLYFSFTRMSSFTWWFMAKSAATLLASLVIASRYSIPSGRVKTPRDPINWPSTRLSGEIRRMIRRRLKKRVPHDSFLFGDALLPVFCRETGSPILITLLPTTQPLTAAGCWHFSLYKSLLAQIDWKG